jgi:hypothetical protein
MRAAQFQEPSASRPAFAISSVIVPELLAYHFFCSGLFCTGSTLQPWICPSSTTDQEPKEPLFIFILHTQENCIAPSPDKERTPLSRTKTAQQQE